jgi:hypothetical protein
VKNETTFYTLFGCCVFLFLISACKSRLYNQDSNTDSIQFADPFGRIEPNRSLMIYFPTVLGSPKFSELWPRQGVTPGWAKSWSKNKFTPMVSPWNWNRRLALAEKELWIGSDSSTGNNDEGLRNIVQTVALLASIDKAVLSTIPEIRFVGHGLGAQLAIASAGHASRISSDPNGKLAAFKGMIRLDLIDPYFPDPSSDSVKQGDKTTGVSESQRKYIYDTLMGFLDQSVKGNIRPIVFANASDLNLPRDFREKSHLQVMQPTWPKSFSNDSKSEWLMRGYLESIDSPVPKVDSSYDPLAFSASFSKEDLLKKQNPERLKLSEKSIDSALFSQQQYERVSLEKLEALAASANQTPQAATNPQVPAKVPFATSANNVTCETSNKSELYTRCAKHKADTSTDTIDDPFYCLYGISTNNYMDQIPKTRIGYEELKSCYRKLSKLWHPDTAGKTADPEIILRLTNSFDQLTARATGNVRELVFPTARLP